ncbi:uncharacterized protein LOC131668929 [Phymastichus coffea]|uniref:uncharacterized protein LOC131668929 n=1 Tax=Phymastichus coffea TaxID=108790 RepID=UPI00273C06D5|nr:uncharacterized protein LOC131668929 [Phymastichus coffea]
MTIMITINMSDRSSDVDINEAFENLLLAENLSEQAAYEEGFQTGKNQLVDGYHLGYHRASSLAALLGYYFGVLICIQHFCKVPKILEKSRALMQKIQIFPLDNNNTVDIFDDFDNIKLNFKKICSLAKIEISSPESNKLDF